MPLLGPDIVRAIKNLAVSKGVFADDDAIPYRFIEALEKFGQMHSGQWEEANVLYDMFILGVDEECLKPNISVKIEVGSEGAGGGSGGVGSSDVQLPDLVNHPPHYTTGAIEHADLVKDWGLDYFLGNCTKYICRAGKKVGADPLQDLEKARWYLNRKIQLMKWPTLTAKEAGEAERNELLRKLIR